MLEVSPPPPVVAVAQVARTCCCCVCACAKSPLRWSVASAVFALFTAAFSFAAGGFTWSYKISNYAGPFSTMAIGFILQIVGGCFAVACAGFSFAVSEPVRSWLKIASASSAVLAAAFNVAGFLVAQNEISLEGRAAGEYSTRFLALSLTAIGLAVIPLAVSLATACCFSRCKSFGCCSPVCETDEKQQPQAERLLADIQGAKGGALADPSM